MTDNVSVQKEALESALRETVGKCVGIAREDYPEDTLTVFVVRQSTDEDIVWAGMASTAVDSELLHRILDATTRGVAARVGMSLVDAVYAGGVTDGDS